MPTTTINDVIPRVQYIANAGQTVFTFAFLIYETDNEPDIKVYLNSTLLDIDTDYSVIILADPAVGGTVTLVVGAALNDIVTLERNIPLSRSIDYQTGGDLLAATLNEDFDRLLLMIQQVANSIDNLALKYEDYSYVLPGDATIPLLDGPKKIWRKNATNTAIEAITLEDSGDFGTLRADLASNAVFEGASLIGKFGTGTVQDFINSSGASITSLTTDVDNVNTLVNSLDNEVSNINTSISSIDSYINTAQARANVAFMAYSNINQSIGASFSVISLNQIYFDTKSYFNTSAYKFMPQIAGYYYITGITGVESPGSIYIISTGISKNGSLTPLQKVSASTVAGSPAYTQVSTIVYLNGVTDYVQLLAYQGSASTNSTSLYNTMLSGYLIN